VSERIPLHALPPLLMIGVVGYLALHEWWLWRTRRSDPVFLWAAGWSAAATVFLAGRFLQRAADTAGAAETATKLQYACAFAIGAVSIAALAAIVEGGRRRAVRAIAGVSAALAAVTLATDLMVGTATYVRTDALGSQYLAARSGPLAPLVLVYAAALGAYGVVLFRRSRARDERRRRFVIAAIGGFALLGAHDALLAMGAIRSIQLLEFAFVGVSLGISWLVIQRVEDLHRDLERSEARFQRLSHATLEGVLVHENGRITDANALAEEMFGEPLIGGRVEELIAGDARRRAAPVVAGMEPGPVEVEGVRADGTTLSIELTGRPGVLALRDVTERKHLQAQLVLADRLASLGTLAAGTAHEINNPLTFVTASVQLLRERIAELPDELRVELGRLADGAAEGCDRVIRIVQDMRTLSRMDDDPSEPFSVNAVVESAAQIAMPQIRPRARLRLQLGALPAVRGSASRLGQVVLNLLVNAAQALHERTYEYNEIRVRTRADGERAVVEVHDNGPGIAPDVLPRVFDPFFTTKPAGVGTGLGLSICHSIVTGMGGDIAVTSRPGATAFTVRLPVERAHAAPLPREPRA
jgi:PAS domain S-box-containing protein